MKRGATRSTWVVGVAFACYTAFAIVRRVGTMLYTRTQNPIDILAIFASIALLCLGLWQMRQRQIRNATLLFVAEAILGLFIFVRLDLPFTRTIGDSWSPRIASYASYIADDLHPEDRRGNAYARLDINNGKNHMMEFTIHYIDRPPTEIFRSIADCRAYAKEKSELHIDAEPLVANEGSVAHADAYCAHLEGNEQLAQHRYRDVAGDNHPTYMGALLAFSDGDLTVARQLVLALQSGPAADREIYLDALRMKRPSPFALFLRSIR